VFTALLIAIVGGGIGSVVGALVGLHLGNQQTIIEKFFPNESVLASPADIQAVLAKVEPSVVEIHTVATNTSGTFAGAGTGMVITSNGEVLTNNHVIDGAVSIEVMLFGQSQERAATVIGTDPAQDLALLQVPGVSGLPTVSLGSSARSAVGDEVIAVGNALDLGGGPTVTEGIISGLGRSLTGEDPLTSIAEHLSGLIQTDAPINAGNSGGPLVNSDGQVVGINTLVIATAGSGNAPAQNVGFAIAADTAKEFLPLLRRGGVAPEKTPKGAFMGVDVLTVTPSIASQANLSVSSGALVEEVVPGDPASKAGITQGDVIIGIGDHPVETVQGLTNILETYSPGTKVAVSIVRGKEHLIKTVTLTARPAVSS
jgi:S1-C subfamily serine protease